MPTFTGDDGNNTLTGGAENDIIVGNGGNDTLSGGDGDDQLFSHTLDPSFTGFNNPGISYDIFADVDTLVGGAGSDYLFAGYGDHVDGGSGGTFGNRLFISFQGAAAGVQADFRLLESQGSIVIGGGTITNIQTIGYLEGSNYADLLVLIAADYPTYPNVYGRGGNDHMISSYVAASLYGGDGDDLIDLRPSNFGGLAYGDAGDDTIYTSFSSQSFAYGGDGDDAIFASGFVSGGSGNDTIVMNTTNFGSTRVDGEAGDDHITAGNAGGSYTGGAGADVIIGGDNEDVLASAGWVDGNFTDDLGMEYDQLFGGGQNDSLAIGLGDSADGGAGIDTLRFSLAGYGTGVTFDTAGIVSGQPFVMGGGTIRNIEVLEYLRGTAFADTFTLATQTSSLTVDAGDGNDHVAAQGSSVTVYGGAGNDSFVSSSAGDVWEGGQGIDSIDYRSATAGVTANLSQSTASDGDILRDIEDLGGSDFDDSLTGSDVTNFLRGGQGDDILSGLAGNDTLDGGSGNDVMRGGLGNDLYLIDSGGDRVLEATGGGYDTAFTLVGFALESGSQVEELRVTDAASTVALNLTGNEFNQILAGNAGANVLNGGGGDDYLEGRGGIDTLDGGTGNDVLRGGSGDDYYIADSVLDRLLEAAGEGFDTAFTSVSFTLEANSEIEALRLADASSTAALNLTGNEFNQILAGNAGANRLDGGGGDDYLEGRGGVDTLNGGTGNDVLRGGIGDDYYIVDSASDRMLEAAGEGFDTAFTSVSFALEDGAEIEALRVSDASGLAALNLTGNAVGQILSGNAGANVLNGAGGDDYLEGRGGVDTLDGGTGNDVLRGGTGNDYYIIDSAADRVLEAAGEGYDVAFTAVGFTLEAGAEVEELRLSDAAGTAALDLAGNEFGQILAGNAGANLLRGGGGNDYLQANGGNDVLDGGSGDDVLIGGDGADRFVFADVGGTDRVMDFVRGTDKIDLTAIDAATGTDGNQAFAFIGANAFSGSAGQLRTYEDGGVGYLAGDIDGNGIADFVINLAFVRVDATDILL